MAFRPIVFMGFIGLTLLAVYTVPTVIDDVNNDRTDTLTIDNQSEVQVYNDLNATVDEVNDGANATVTVEDTDAGVTASDTINVSSSNTFTLDGDDVTVTVNSASSSDAELEFTYSPTFGYSDGMTFLLNNLGMFVLGFFVIIFFPLAWTAV